MLICFDGDRTLWDLAYDYNDCCVDLKEWMYEEFKWVIPMEIINITLDSHLKFENKKDGCHRSRFPLCVMRTFNSIYLYEKEVTPPVELLAKAFRIGDKIYDTPPTINKNSFALIDSIKTSMPTSPMMLLTLGDRVVQSGKIHSTGLDKVLFDTRITESKDKEFYQSIFEENKSKSDGDLIDIASIPSDCIMIGDSISRDILPAIEAGWRAIYIPSKQNTKESFVKTRHLYIADNLLDVFEILISIKDEKNDLENRQVSQMRETGFCDSPGIIS